MDDSDEDTDVSDVTTLDAEDDTENAERDDDNVITELCARDDADGKDAKECVMEIDES